MVNRMVDPADGRQMPVSADTPISVIAELLGADAAGMFRCLLHADRTPSAQIWADAEGRPGIHCYAGCDDSELRRAIIAPAATRPRVEWRVACTYQQPDGRLVQALRYDNPGGGGCPHRTRRRNEYIPCADTSPHKHCAPGQGGRPVASLPVRGLLVAILNDRQPGTVVLVEGEKAAAAVAAAGYTAGCWYGGTESARHANYAPLAGRMVYLWPDDDAAGRRAMDTAGRMAAAAGAHIVGVIPSTGESGADAADMPLSEIAGAIAGAAAWTPSDDAPDAPDAPDDAPPDDQPPVELLARFAPGRFAVVDRAHLAINRPDFGTWLPLTDGRTPAVRGTLLVLIQQCRAAAGYDNARLVSMRTAQECIAALSAWIVQPPPGVLIVHQDDFDAAPVLPLRAGGGIHLRTGEVISPADLPAHLISDTGQDGIDYRPEVLDTPAPAAIAVLSHYGIGLFRRFARNLIEPDKCIDTISLPRSSSGKTTLADALEYALPGQVAVADGPASFSAQGLKFSSPAGLLASNRLVIFDESDKITAPPPPGALNALTARRLRIEPKGRDAYYAPRRANALMLGADKPALELGQGAETRFVWSHTAHLPELPAGLRDWMLSPDGGAWLATWLVDAAIDIALNGDDTDTPESRRAAQSVLEQNADPLIDALLDWYEPGDPDDWCSIPSIKDTLAQAGVGVAGDLNSRTIAAALTRIAPESTTTRRVVERRTVSGRLGLRLRADAAAAETAPRN